MTIFKNILLFLNIREIPHWMSHVESNFMHFLFINLFRNTADNHVAECKLNESDTKHSDT